MKKTLLSLGIISLLSSIAVYGAVNQPQNTKVTTNSSANTNLTPKQSKNTSSTQPQSLEEFRFLPQLTLWGLTGENTSEEGQLMLPLGGDANRLLYVVGDGTVVNDESRWTGSFGAGYRQVVGGNNILGAYVLGEDTNTDNNHDFWAINPGIESLGKLWDFRANGYIVVGEKQWLESEGFQSDRGIDSSVFQTGHQFYDNKFKQFNYANNGIGVDAEVGRKFPALKNLKLFVGGYHFDIQDNSDINGFSARAEFPITNYLALDMRESYDNYKHNTVLGGIKINLFGISAKQKEHFGISGRLMEPIIHNISTNYTGLPTRSRIIVQTERSLKYDHVWYFNSDPSSSQMAGAVSGDGTFENPYSGIDDPTMTHIEGDPNGINYAHLFFAGEGNSYSLSDFTNSRILLPENYDLMGRMDDFRLPATGDNRPIFYGGIDIPFGNNLLDSFILYNNNGMQQIGINIQMPLGAVNNVTMQNIVVGDQSAQLGYIIGVEAFNINNATLDSSNIYGYTNNSSTAFGVLVTNSQIDILNNNVISSTATSSGMGYGIFSNSTGSGSLTISGSGNSIFATGNSAFGVAALNNTLIIGGSNNLISATDTNSGLASGIYVSDSTVNITGSNNTIAADSGSEAFGIDMVGPTSFINVSNTTFNIAQNSIPVIRAAGIDIDSSASPSNLTATNNFFNVAGGNGYGIFSDNAFSPAQRNALINDNTYSANLVADGQQVFP